MHVLYFHQYFSTPTGSTGTRSYEMAKALVDAGHKVTMVCGTSQLSDAGLQGQRGQRTRYGEVDGINVVEIDLEYSNHQSLWKRALLFLKYSWLSVGIARRTRYDVLFATSTPLTAGIPGIVMRLLKPKQPFVFEVRDLWPELPKAMGVIKNPAVLGAMGVLETLSYKAAKQCVALSPGIREGILKKRANATVAMIPNGCDLEFFNPVTGSESGRLKTVFTGAHGMANGLDAVLDAAAELKQRGDERVEFHFIGDGKLKPHLVQRAEKEGLNSCHFHAPMPKTELRDAMADYDVGLMILDNVPAFYYGTSPNKFFDYLAAGMPVLNNYPGWLASLIDEHNCGIAVPPNNPMAFADALQKMADNPAQTRAMGTSARALGESTFNRRTLAAEFVQFLEKARD